MSIRRVFRRVLRSSLAVIARGKRGFFYEGGDMTQKFLTSMILSAAFLGGFSRPAAPPSASDAGGGWAIAVPQPSLDFDEGLDARDAQNRPLGSFSARRELKALFVSRLYELFLNPVETPRATLSSLIRRAWQSAAARIGPWQPFELIRGLDVCGPALRKTAKYFARAAGASPAALGPPTSSSLSGFHASQILLQQSSVVLRF
jgi:hypothetical protein